MQTYVYKSLRKENTYVYLRKRDDFAVMPEAVRANLAAHGFHLQFPPTLPDPMVDG